MELQKTGYLMELEIEEDSEEAELDEEFSDESKE